MAFIVSLVQVILTFTVYQIIVSHIFIVRISPATAKFKQALSSGPADLPQVQLPSPGSPNGQDHQSQPVTIAVPMPNGNQSKSVSGPAAGPTTSASNSSLGNTISTSDSASSFASTLLSSLSSNNSISSMLATSEGRASLPPHVLEKLGGQISPQSNENGVEESRATPQSQQENPSIAQKYGVPEESWKHHAQARAILGNLIGPNGEQLTSTDPYNTTVFVGGLSPLIGEETLRSFFAPFGEIHYVGPLEKYS